MGTIKIEKGMTEWQVLEKFCNGRYGKVRELRVRDLL